VKQNEKNKTITEIEDLLNCK